MCEIEMDDLLDRWQLAELFGVTISAINANIKAIIHSGAVKVDYEGAATQVGMEILPDLYSIEMVVAVAFRIDSPEACRIRKWVIRKISVITSKPAVLYQINIADLPKS